MRVMKDSGIEWIGQIPRAWQVVRVKHLATQKDSLFLDGDWINSDVITTEGIRYLTSGNVGEGAYKEQGNGHISEETFEKLNCLKAFPGDLMISRLNEPVGRCCIIPEGHPFYVVAVDNVILRPDDGYNKKFIMYCMNTQGYAHAALMAASGTTMVRISRTSLGNLTIPVASVEEQERIAEYLDTKCADIDALIAAKEKTNTLLKERRQSIIYEAVTKGLNPDAPMKDSGIEWIGQIPENWDMLRLRFLGTFQNGISKAGEFFGSGYPFVSYGDVYKNEVLPTTPSGLVESTESEQKLYSVEKGDVFFTRTSETKEEIGIVAVCKETIPNATFAGFLIRMRPTTNVVTTDFLRYYFSCGLQREYFSKEMTLVTRASLGQDLLKNMVVTIPSAEEQEAIVNYLDKQTQAIDSIIANNDVSVQKLKEYRQSIIYEAVTGKIEV